MPPAEPDPSIPSELPRPLLDEGGHRLHEIVRGQERGIPGGHVVEPIGHEATVSKVGDDQLFYLMSRGLSETQAMGMIVNGFIEPITRTLPMEYAVEWSRLIELQMEGSIG